MSLDGITPGLLNHRIALILMRFCAVGILLGLVAESPAQEAEQAAAPLPINRGLNQKLSHFTLKDAVSGRPYSLNGFAGKKAVVLVFLGTECPLASVYAPRLEELSRAYRAQGVAFLGINSNAPRVGGRHPRASPEVRPRFPHAQGSSERGGRPRDCGANARGPGP